MKSRFWRFVKIILTIIFTSSRLFAVHVFDENYFKEHKNGLVQLIKNNPSAVTRHLYGIPYKRWLRKDQQSDPAIVIWAISNGRYKALEEIFKIAQNPEISVLSDKITPKSIVDILKYQEPSTGNTALHYAASHVIQAQKKTDLLLQKIPKEQKLFFIKEIKNNDGKSVWDIATDYSKPSLKVFVESGKKDDSEKEPEVKPKKESVFDKMKVPLEKKLKTPTKAAGKGGRKPPTRTSVKDRIKKKEEALKEKEQEEKERQEALEKKYAENKNTFDQKLEEFKALKAQRRALQKEIESLDFDVKSPSKNKTAKMVQIFELNNKIKDKRKEIIPLAEDLEVELTDELDDNFDDEPEKEPEVKPEEDVAIKNGLIALTQRLHMLKEKLQELRESLENLRKAF